MDLTQEWRTIVQDVLSTSDIREEQRTRIKSEQLLKPTKTRSQFMTVVDTVHDGIKELEQFIQGIKRDYTSSGKFDNKEKDRIEQEVGSVVRTCTKQIEQLKNSVVSAQNTLEDGEPVINEQTAAHLHGVVLVLVEQLHTVSASFDKCRAVRYQQSLAKELQQHRKVTLDKGHKLGGSSWHEGEEGDGQFGMGQQRQQQKFENPEVQQLMDELTTTSQQAFQVERTMREVTTLNQMISTAVMQQAESIEQLYNTAVEATFNIQRGNKSLRKALALNRSSSRYVFVLLMVASLLLLFFDWFYS